MLWGEAVVVISLIALSYAWRQQVWSQLFYLPEVQFRDGWRLWQPFYQPVHLCLFRPDLSTELQSISTARMGR